MTTVDTAAFRAELIEQGFQVAERVWEPGLVNHTHTHDFDVRALVIEGAITLTHAESSRSYGPGEEFRLEADIEHEEIIGPEGVSFIAGRRAKGQRVSG